MLHELKEIVNHAIVNQHKNIKNVLVTVVDLEGSSYRKPGVRMLISENNSMIGAVSGGCVEKEIARRSQSVFKNNIAKVITYNGKYRIGCEGILYILIEPFFISDEFLTEFSKAIQERNSLKITSYYKKEDEMYGNFGSIINCNDRYFNFSDTFSNTTSDDLAIFSQVLEPIFRLIIIGGEHDAVKLCKVAATLGWEVTVLTNVKDSKNSSDFPGAKSVIGSTPETVTFNNIHHNTAIVVMNHSFVKDLQYLLKLSKHKPAYIGVLGAPKRREKLFNALLEYNTDIDDTFLEAIFTPAGLNIGAETPEEIAFSIISEILAVTRKKEVRSLREHS